MMIMSKTRVYPIMSTATRLYSKFQKLKTNPGIKKRQAALNPTDLKDFQDMELDDLETDFMDVHKSYKQHIEDTNRMNERLKYLIVKNKYFKEKYPNFLTWSDKEQIKFLYSKDPEEWTVEKLSESFPALPEAVMKIVKAKFSKSDLKIRKHDAVVEKNWNHFKKGKFTDLPQELTEHLNKFTSRKINTQYLETKMEVVNTPTTVPSDFLDIISSYEKLKNKNQHPDTENKCIDIKLDPNIENNKLDMVKKNSKIKDKKLSTLSELHNTIEEKEKLGMDLSEEEKVILLEFNRNKEISVSASQNHKDNIITLSENKYNSSTGFALMKKTERDYSHLQYPQRIIIPDKLKKKGCTYRLNDCFYDYDGEFLYRVPGMG